MMDKYTCSVCEETFIDTWTTEEALKELRDNFGVTSVENAVSICDDCYLKYKYTWEKQC